MTRIPKDTPNEQRHVALVGFMGAGKSSVGRIVAERIGSPFVDLDDVIVKRAGKTIPELFRDHGEVGFRAHERAALREVLALDLPQVIALGGGTFVDASMRAWVKQAAKSIYLSATQETLLARLGQAEQKKRPLLSGPDPALVIRRLMNERRPAYESCDLTVVTDEVSIEQVASEIISALKSGRASAKRSSAPRPKHTAPRAEASEPTSASNDGSAKHTSTDGSALLRVHAAAGTYPVELRPDAGAWIVDAICALTPTRRVALITDTTVERLHAGALVAELRERGKTVSVHVVPPGEGSKSISTAGTLFDELADANLGRKDAVVALGGGVVGDLSGFVASTYMRGVDYFQVPTTTLAAIDSSVGGKTALNTSRGKNLVGSFYPPRAVLVAAAHLSTQAPREHHAGLVEALKIAATCDASLFFHMRDAALLLSRYETQTLLGVIARAVQLKADIVARDERESGERAVLNYGHTIGHAIEAGEGYRLLHGEAVALGMLAECAWAESCGLAEKHLTQVLTDALTRMNIPTEWKSARVDLVAMGLDKKRDGATVRMPVVSSLGRYALRDVPLESLARFVEERRI